MKQRIQIEISKLLLIAFRLICLLASFIIIISTSLYGYFINLLFLICLCAGTLVLILYSIRLIDRKMVFIVLFIDYFFILLHPYFTPNLIIFEFIWLPEILFVIAVFFPGISGIFFIVIMGIPGSIFMGYGYYQKLVIAVNESSYPFQLLIIPYYFSVTLSAVMLCVYFIRNKKRDEYIKSLETLNNQLNNINHSVSQKIFSLQNVTSNEERKRISKEIHDTAGYVFVNLIMMLQAASAVFYKDSKKAENLINDARNYAERGINEIRHILRKIHNYTPVRISLQNEIYDTGTAFSRATGVEININYGNWPHSFADNIDSFFLSFMQESLTNALKHGHASSISISCWGDEYFHTMSITDNGTGIKMPIKKGIGITALEDEVNRYHGRIVIKSECAGFGIQVSIPISPIMES